MAGSAFSNENCDNYFHHIDNVICTHTEKILVAFEPE